MKFAKRYIGNFAVIMLAVTMTAGPAAAEDVAAPEGFAELLDAQDNGKAVVSEKGKETFNKLPSHAKNLFYKANEAGFLSSSRQLEALLSLELEDEKYELLLENNCVLCHTNPDEQSDETLIRLRTDPQDEYFHLDLKEIVSDVHFRRGLLCSGCHGGSPDDEEMSDEIYDNWPKADVRKTDRSWVPEFCTKCHADPNFMLQYNPGLPIDQMLKYKESRHGQLLLGKGDSKAAQCISCHGVHGIRSPDSPRSMVYPLNIPFTCGKCHGDAEYMTGYKDHTGAPIPTDQLDEYKKSVHGKALLEKKDVGAPACNDCHGNHAALPPDISHVSQVCRQCHVNNGILFDGSQHKKQFEKHGWPECETCHGNHGVERPTHAMLVGPESVCDACHAKFAQNNPLCSETPKYFFDQLTGLGGSTEALEHELDELMEKGMQVEELSFKIDGIGDALVAGRSKIHSFNKSDFDSALKDGKDIKEEVEKGIEEMKGEYDYRREGLLLSTIIISLFGLILYFKIREADKIIPPRKIN